MRTTVTLDPHVERLLRRAMAERGLSFKVALNEAIERGLTGLAAADEEPFVVAASPLGLRAGIDPARFNALADELEADAFVELDCRTTRTA